ncbi:MAG: M20/M25/M40 family metallo-hydrolase, partial [Nocardioidaceae bacterium]
MTDRTEGRRHGSDAGVSAAWARPVGDETLVEETVEFCSRLIRFDTSNFGGGDSRGEREAAQWVAGQLTDAGYDPAVLESAPGRASTVLRIPGADPGADALLV